MIIAARPGSPDTAIEEAVDRVNATLPEYARVRRWLRAEAPFSFAGGELTANGRLPRDQLARRYGAAVESLYLEESDELLR